MDSKDRYISQLESENRYLRRLLDDNGIVYDYDAHLRKSRAEVGDIIFSELTSEHAIQFYSYFRCRKDVYARRSPKKGYYTQCNNFWKSVCPKAKGDKIKCQECPAKDYTILKVPAILAHLRGHKEDCSDVIGLYPLFPDGTCWFLVFDFDNHDEDNAVSKDWEQEVDVIRKMCYSLGIDALVERSRSGNGAHVWIFFQEAIQAQKARKFGEALLAKGAESVSVKGFSYYDRMMPMQEYLPDGKLGNLIALPLQGQALKRGNSAFVDDNWEPYKDQWNRLLSTKKLSEKEIDDFINLWCPGNDAMEIFHNNLNDDDNQNIPLFGTGCSSQSGHFKVEDVIGMIKIILSDGIYVEKHNLRPRLQNAVRRMAAYSNPKFWDNLRLGLSTKETPRIIYCGYDIDDYIVIPRGCFDNFKSQLEMSQIPYELCDKRFKGRSIDVSFNGSLYPEQSIAASKMLSFDCGILSATTSFGKTVLGSYLISQRRVNTLVLVHNVEILNNWITDLSRLLTINEELPTYTTPKGRIKKRPSLIGTFSSQKNSTTGIVDIAMITSLGKEDNINQLVRNYGMIIVDECHHSAAATHSNVLRAVTAKYMYGMTATVKRADKQDKKIFLQLGPVLHSYTAKERAMKQGIGHFIYPRFTSLLDVESVCEKHISEAYRLVMQSELRNSLIVSDTIECVKMGRTPVLMTKYKEHANMLFEKLQGCADHIFLLQGGKSHKERDLIREQMASVGKNESIIVVAIGQYIGEGFNYPRLDTMLMAMPISFDGNVEQYAGRLNRDYDGKKDVIIFDYIDNHIPVLERMYHKRLRTYKRIGYEICSEIKDNLNVSNSIFDSSNYHDVFEKDITQVSKSIVISSPYLGGKRVHWLADLSSVLHLKGVSLTVMTLSSENYPEDGREHHEELISILEKSGICVRMSSQCHERFAVIDKSLIWYGSMNLLSNAKEEDSLMRLESKSVAEELLQFSIIKYNTL